MGFADPQRKIIRKTRYCFLWENQYFELDEHKEYIPGMDYKHVLEIELTGIEQKVKMPPFIEIAQEATGDKRFSNYNLARRNE